MVVFIVLLPSVSSILGTGDTELLAGVSSIDLSVFTLEVSESSAFTNKLKTHKQKQK